VGLGLVVTRDGGIPLTWHANPGDRPDVTQFATMTGQLAVTCGAASGSGDVSSAESGDRISQLGHRRPQKLRAVLPVVRAMRIFVTGATGGIGSAVVPELIGAGHEVVGLARSEKSASTLSGFGASALWGDMNDPAALRAGAADSDGVIHLAFGNDFNDFDRLVAEETLAVDVLTETLRGTWDPALVCGSSWSSWGRRGTSLGSRLGTARHARAGQSRRAGTRPGCR
jgi:NADPH:quinone reductase-like Zn-dependent oxidoreductase